MIARNISRPLSWVNKKNLIAAYTRFSWPQRAIRKYIGTSIISQKNANRNRSSARNRPTSPDKTHIRWKWNSPVCWRISVHEAATATIPKKAVRRINSRLRPSMAR